MFLGVVIRQSRLAASRLRPTGGGAHSNIAMLALLAAFVTGCGGGDANGDPAALTMARVTRPGEVLFNPQARQRALATMPAPLRDAWCLAANEAGAMPAPVTRLRDRPSGPDTASEPFARAVMTATAAGFAGDADARHRLVDLLDQWAQAGALTEIERPTANAYYALDRTLLPTLVGFALLRDTPELTTMPRLRIQAWLQRLDRLRGPDRPSTGSGQVSGRNNHHYLRGSVDIAWGALTGDDARFRLGVAAYLDALHDMRPDGSLPLETRRRARALWYQRHAIASLVVIGEIAATQGLDLYDLTVDGKSLHTAVRFLLDAIDDQERVAGYAWADQMQSGRHHPRQDLSFLVRRGHGRHYMAWAEIYLARFPARPESRRLLALLAGTDPSFRPMVDDYAGGDTTCFFARPDLAGLPGM